MGGLEREESVIELLKPQQDSEHCSVCTAVCFKEMSRIPTSLARGLFL